MAQPGLRGGLRGVPLRFKVEPRSEDGVGTEMIAFIEYDSTTDRWEFHPDPAVALPPPFSKSQGEPYSLTGEGGIYTGSSCTVRCSTSGPSRGCRS